MILAALAIENYKQFRGTHQIEFPSTGIVGIIGANGAGKTTLFEAIEWCLYNPSTIQNPDVVPRGTAERTRVTLTLEDPDDGSRYVVARSLRGGKTSSAEIFREDDPEHRITQGPREATRYVASRLIGLSHSAFVSTFFTRQKELSFFGNVSTTDRRVAVARLLGYETIRMAQEQLGKDRSQVRHAAEALRSHHAEQIEGRDFPAEMAALNEGVTLSGQRVSATDQAVEQTKAALAAATQEAERWRNLERHHATLSAGLGRIEGDIRAITARHESARASLADLDVQAAKRTELAPVASRIEERERMLTGHEAARGQHERAQRLHESLQRATAGIERAARSAERAVVEAKAGAIDQWFWRDGDAEDPVAATTRLQHIALGLDHDAAREQVTTLERLRSLATDEEQKSAHHMRCLQTLETIQAKIAEIMAGGDPEQDIASARHKREQAVLKATTIDAEAKNLAAHRVRMETIVTTLQQMTFDQPASVCPTCQRPFSADDADATIQALSERIAELRQEETAARNHEREARAAADAAGHDLSSAEERRRLLSEERERLRKGEGITAGAEAAMNTAAGILAAALATARRQAIPDPGEVDAAREHLARLERILRATATLRQIETEARQHAEDAKAARDAIARLGPVSYDEAQHQAARQAVDDAREAVTRVRDIERQLIRRAEFETMLANAEATLAGAHAEQATLTKEREALGFTTGRLHAAAQAEAAARAWEREALDALGEARAAHTEALNRRHALAQEHERIHALARRADALIREQETLNQIYDEFTAFDRYVANRVTPYLAEQTSELLATVTDNRYDHVQFDKDYGLRVYDGPIDSFPISAFSGGERDVVALCARLALSRVVGAQATNPPSFLVLDEVFGALDQDRRTHVLHTLGVLSGTAEAYRQLFIISHVDDIRQSPVFDEVWRISEGPTGSYVERIDQTGALEEA